MYVLDTNVVIAVMTGTPAKVRFGFKEALSRQAVVAVSAIALFELRYGVAHSRRGLENAERLRRFLAGMIKILEFDEEDASVAAEVRQLLETAGTPIGPYDLLIAAQALRHDATLVTANAREFAQVPGLRCEDWGG